MSGGPQVFLGATTLLCGCCAARFPAAARALGWGRAAWCARGRRPAREPSALRASLGASSRSPARPRRRPRAPQPGPAAAHVHRSQAPQASRRPPIGRPSLSAMSHVIPLHVFQTLKTYRWNCNVLSGARKLTPGNYVRLLFWLTLWPRRIDNETPLNNDAVRGLVLTVIRWLNASSLPRRCSRRSPPR